MGLRVLWFNLATDDEDPVLGFTSSWIRAVARNVDFVNVMTTRFGRSDLPSNVKVCSLGKERGHRRPRRALAFYRHLVSIIGRHPIDVCFSHMNPVFTIMAAPLLRLKRIPIVTWFAHPALPWQLRLAHRMSTRMVTSLRTAYPYKDDKLTVIGQGIDTQLFRPEAAEEQAEHTVLCAGRLSPVKDHMTLFRAVSILRCRAGSRFKVLIIGGPAGSEGQVYTQMLRREVLQLDLDGLVEFVGSRPIRELPQWYNRCSVHVNLTPKGFGDKVALEAMSCGRPSLVANEGFREILGRYQELLLFRCQEPEELARKVDRVLRLSDHERSEIGGYLRDQVVRQHSLDSLAMRLVRMFATLHQDSIGGATAWE